MSHCGIDDTNKQTKIDSTVSIHVREVVMAGSERRAAIEGKVVVFVDMSPMMFGVPVWEHALVGGFSPPYVGGFVEAL